MPLLQSCRRLQHPAFTQATRAHTGHARRTGHALTRATRSHGPRATQAMCSHRPRVLTQATHFAQATAHTGHDPRTVATCAHTATRTAQATCSHRLRVPTQASQRSHRPCAHTGHALTQATRIYTGHARAAQACACARLRPREEQTGLCAVLPLLRETPTQNRSC